MLVSIFVKRWQENDLNIGFSHEVSLSGDGTIFYKWIGGMIWSSLFKHYKLHNKHLDCINILISYSGISLPLLCVANSLSFWIELFSDVICSYIILYFCDNPKFEPSQCLLTSRALTESFDHHLNSHVHFHAIEVKTRATISFSSGLES